MARVLKFLGLGLIALIFILQFFQPERNDLPVDPELDMLSLVSLPEATAELVRQACYDCHSNQTYYPWYSRISPVSWYLKSHIVKGKEELNFSLYGKLNKADKIGFFSDICEVMDAGSMPLQSYQLLHKDARLEQEQREMICQWAEEEALRVMRE